MTTAQSSNDIHFDSLKQCIIYNPPIKSTHGSTFSSNTHQECPPVISLLCYIYCRLFSTGKAKRITTGDATHVFLCFATVYNEFSFTGNAHLYLLLIIYLTWQYHTNKSNSTKHLRIPLPHTPSNFMMPYLQSHHLLSPKHQSKWSTGTSISSDHHHLLLLCFHIIYTKNFQVLSKYTYIFLLLHPYWKQYHWTH